MSDAPHDPPPVPPFAPQGDGALDRALELVRYLREHCPWDREQTPASLVPHLLEETHEVVDAIRDGDADALEGELGDLLLNLAFQVVLAEEEGHADAASVYERLEAKMVRRHPHLFGGGERRGWEELKAAERKGNGGVLEGLPRGLDSLTRAHRMQERAAGVGFDWDDYRGALAKVREELGEVTDALAGEDDAAVEDELGDLLFSVVNLTRLAGRHPTTALERANEKFRARFERLESVARSRGIRMADARLEELDALWEEVKRG